jgi:antitoxin component of RelBE/YafQ-DinJ toxin-antitoxin module
MVSQDTVLMPIKTNIALKEEATEIFKSRGLTLTSGVNLLLRDFVRTKKLVISFSDEIEELNPEEVKKMNTLKNMSSFLDSIPS